MKTLQDKFIIGVDHGYGNMKTANHCFKTGILGYDSEPLFTGDMLICNGRYYLIGEGHKEYVEGIFRRLREHGYDEGTMMLYITGGGGCLVKNFGKVNTDRVKFIDDICAAAKGYEYLAEAQLKAGMTL